MQHKKPLGLGHFASGLALALTIASSSAWAEPVTVIKTGVIEGGENICLGSDGGTGFVANPCSWFAARPETGLVHDNGRVRPKHSKALALGIVGTGGVQFGPGDDQYKIFRFETDYLGEPGWKAMRSGGGQHLGSNCMALRRPGNALVLQVGVDAFVDPSIGFETCARRNIPENQVWLETLSPPAGAFKPMFLKFDYPIKGQWPHTEPLVPGVDNIATLPRLCAGFDAAARAWVLDECGRLGAARSDTQLQYSEDLTVRNSAGQCLTRTSTVHTEMRFEACAMPSDYQRFVFVEKHEGDPLWPALVAAAGTVDGGTLLSGSARDILPASDKPSAACLSADPHGGKMLLGHCETYSYGGQLRTLRSATRTVSMQEIP